jgi:hypothetical protein
MERALSDRLLKFKDEVNWSGDISPEDLKKATLFTLKTLKAYLQETKPSLDADIDSLTCVIPIIKVHLE